MNYGFACCTDNDSANETMMSISVTDEYKPNYSLMAIDKNVTIV